MIPAQAVPSPTQEQAAHPTSSPSQVSSVHPGRSKGKQRQCWRPGCNTALKPPLQEPESKPRLETNYNVHPGVQPRDKLPAWLRSIPEAGAEISTPALRHPELKWCCGQGQRTPGEAAQGH